MDIWSAEAVNSYPMLYALRSEWQKSQKLNGLRILHNIPNSFDTLLKVEYLLQAGANVTVTCMKAIRVANEDHATQQMKT